MYHGPHCEFEGAAAADYGVWKNILADENDDNDEKIPANMIILYIVLLNVFFIFIGMVIHRIVKRYREQSTVNLHMKSTIDCPSSSGDGLDATEQTRTMVDSQGNKLEEVDLL